MYDGAQIVQVRGGKQTGMRAGMPDGSGAGTTGYEDRQEQGTKPPICCHSPYAGETWWCRAHPKLNSNVEWLGFCSLNCNVRLVRQRRVPWQHCTTHFSSTLPAHVKPGLPKRWLLICDPECKACKLVYTL